MRSCEGLNCSDFVNYSSSAFVSSEEEMVEYLKRIDEKMERKNYAVAAKDISEDVSLEESNILLKTLLKYSKSFFGDDLDMLELKKINEEALLVFFDVINLYTNIPHDYGIKAIKFCLEKYTEVLPERINQIFIIESLKIILQNNYFPFDDTYYRQKCGIAMGTKQPCSSEPHNGLY
eukprot:XP_014779426.1 PREDICTED: uncharacterized protein LOC106875695 [Octopus bimaculoides]